MDIKIVAGKIEVSDFGAVRTTEDGWLSVYDLIRVCCTAKSINYPVNTFESLTLPHRYPELIGKTKRHKFPGARQKDTLICSKETALEIIGLLPGAIGNKYRMASAKLMLTFLEQPEELAKAAIARVEDPEKLAEISEVARQKYLAQGYRPHMEEIKALADGDQWAYININRATTKAILKEEPKNLLEQHKQETGKKLKSARQLPEALEKIHLFEACHAAQLGVLKAKNISGSSETQQACLELTEKFAEMLRSIGL